MKKPPKDPMHQRVILGTNAGGSAAIERARETATPLVVWEGGRIQEISAEEAALRRSAKPSNV